VDDVVGGGRGKDAAVSYDSDTGGPPGCVALGSQPLNFRPADVLILLDRSGSMDTAYGSGTRYQAVAAMLSDLVATYGAHVRFGYQEMPGRQGCDAALAGGCCASPPLLSSADGNAPAVTAAIASALPMDGNTPTAASLQAALAYYETLTDGIDNRYVLLATDGAPNCTLDGSLSGGPTSAAPSAACAEALSQVSTLAALGVQVIVLGVGSGLEDGTSGDSACLDALAHAGGVAASPGSPGFFTLSTREQLQMVIEQIFGGVTRPPCSVHFRAEVDDTSTIEVYLDGKKIPRGQGDGWQLDLSTSPPAVLITGAYCDQIQTFQVTTVEARFECPPCVDIVGCK
jgi:hypothetical protein